MIEPLRHGDGKIDMFPDPWNATHERAFSVVCDELRDMSTEQYRERIGSSDDATTGEVRVETKRLSSQRIYMPTYVVEYTILGVTYQAFLSGCNHSVQVSGVSHKNAFSAGSGGVRVLEGASSFLSGLSCRAVPTVATALQLFGLRPFVAVARVRWAMLSRVAMKFHVIGLFSGAYIAWKKIIAPTPPNGRGIGTTKPKPSNCFKKIHFGTPAPQKSTLPGIERGYYTRSAERRGESTSRRATSGTANGNNGLGNRCM